MSGDIRYSSGKIIFVDNVAQTVPIRTSEPSGANGDIYYNSTTNKFRKYENGTWSDWSSGGGGGSGVNINKFTLNGTDISNKYVTLSSIPATPANVILNIIGGIVQDYSVDFTMSGDQLSWTGLGLDGVLASGDKLIVQFD